MVLKSDVRIPRKSILQKEVFEALNEAPKFPMGSRIVQEAARTPSAEEKPGTGTAAMIELIQISIDNDVQHLAQLSQNLGPILLPEVSGPDCPKPLAAIQMKESGINSMLAQVLATCIRLGERICEINDRLTL